jgi:hypothetical protein
VISIIKIILSLFLLTILFNGVLLSQSTILTENFEGSFPPSGWAVQTISGNAWAIGGTPCSGGGSNQARSTYNSPSDAWLFTSGLTLKNGYTYSVKINLADNLQDLRIYVGTAQTKANMTGASGSLITTFSTDPNCTSVQSSDWSCTADGTYYFAFNHLDGSSGPEIDNIEIIESLVCAYPSSQTTLNAFSDVGSDRITVNWTRGDGDNVLIVAKKNSATLTAPGDAGSYTADAAFGAGSQLGTGNFVVYKGTGTSVIVTELDASTTYDFYAYEFKNTGPCYLRPGATASQATTRSTNYYINDGTLNTDDFYTTAIGNNSNQGTRPSIPKRNLLNVLSSFSGTFLAGDTIFVDAGTYTENDLSSPVNGVVIKGLGPDKSIFTKSGTDHYFMNIDDDNTVLRDFKISGYDATTASSTGKAIHIAGVTGIQIISVQIDNNGAGSGTMPIRINANSTAVFDGGGTTCNNTSLVSGGFLVTGNNIDLTIKNYQFIDNEINDGATKGSCISMINGTVSQKVVVMDSRFIDNKNSRGGAAIFMSSSAGDLKIYDCIFDNNDGTGTAEIIYGTCLDIEGGAALISRCEIKNSNSTNTTSYGVGTVYANGSNATLTVDSCIFSSNTSSSGNDVYVRNGSNTSTFNSTNSTYSSSATNIVQITGSATISKCTNGTTPTKSGTISDDGLPVTYTASPNPPNYTGSCATSVVLPVELLFFKYLCNSSEFLLVWQTGSELNNNYFIIQESTDALNYTNIGYVNSKGNSSVVTEYAYSFQPNPNSYFRLMQVDNDGTTLFFQPIFYSDCIDSDSLAFNVFYSPATNHFNVSIRSIYNSNYQLIIYDLHGKIKHSATVIMSESYSSFDISSNYYDTGIYLFVLVDKLSGAFITKKVMKID